MASDQEIADGVEKLYTRGFVPKGHLPNYYHKPPFRGADDIARILREFRDKGRAVGPLAAQALTRHAEVPLEKRRNKKGEDVVKIPKHVETVYERENREKMEGRAAALERLYGLNGETAQIPKRRLPFNDRSPLGIYLHNAQIKQMELPVPLERVLRSAEIPLKPRHDRDGRVKYYTIHPEAKRVKVDPIIMETAQASASPSKDESWQDLIDFSGGQEVPSQGSTRQSPSDQYGSAEAGPSWQSSVADHAPLSPYDQYGSAEAGPSWQGSVADHAPLSPYDQNFQYPAADHSQAMSGPVQETALQDVAFSQTYTADDQFQPSGYHDDQPAHWMDSITDPSHVSVADYGPPSDFAQSVGKKSRSHKSRHHNHHNHHEQQRKGKGKSHHH
ncbi:hypothetical protein [Streptomyces sp. OE57]|uniref:hypothetical protein n=1 Tax=Streptomyces lacaronensis TaxID=3379885 RepID=UPI0039B7455C